MSSATGTGFNYQDIGGSFGRATGAAESKMRGFMKSMDPTNTSDLIKFQAMSNEWSVAMNLESTTVKVLGDALRGVVQKIG
jgi:type III secretion protein F